MHSKLFLCQDIGIGIEGARTALRDSYKKIQSTYHEDVISGVGGFGGVFALDQSKYTHPLLVSSMDCVGSKSLIATMVGKFDTLGQDIVYHCANDILCQGAQPLFFLDHYGSSYLDPQIFKDVLDGMVEACASLECALLGGSVTQLPEVYVHDEMEIVGTIVGAVDQSSKLPRGKMEPGDAIIGLGSNGLHSSGYALAKQIIFEIGALSLSEELPGLGATIGEELLRPHHCYWKTVYPLLSEIHEILAISHITHGGLYQSLPRIMSLDLRAVIDSRSWTVPPIFKLIQDTGKLSKEEMFHAFNMGIGMVLFVSKDFAPAVVQRLSMVGEAAAIIGEVQKGSHDVQIL